MRAGLSTGAVAISDGRSPPDVRTKGHLPMSEDEDEQGLPLDIEDGDEGAAVTVARTGGSRRRVPVCCAGWAAGGVVVTRRVVGRIGCRCG